MCVKECNSMSGRSVSVTQVYFVHLAWMKIRRKSSRDPHHLSDKKGQGWFQGVCVWLHSNASLCVCVCFGTDSSLSKKITQSAIWANPSETPSDCIIQTCESDLKQPMLTQLDALIKRGTDLDFELNMTNFSKISLMKQAKQNLNSFC